MLTDISRVSLPSTFLVDGGQFAVVVIVRMMVHPEQSLLHSLYPLSCSSVLTADDCLKESQSKLVFI